MDLGIQNKTALVLGASGGLGGAISAALAREGVRVALCGTNIITLERNTAAIRQAGGLALSLPWNLADLGAMDGVVRSVETQLGAIDILINNTGGPPPTTAAGQDPSLWAKHFQLMVMSVIGLTDRVLPSMRARKWGRIITSASSGVVAPIPNLGISNTLRAALSGWSKTLAREIAADGITANLVLPGRIGTPRITFLDEQRAERESKTVSEVASQSIATIPAGRYGTTEEYADVVAFLASARASYITGSIIRVDGGMVPSI